MRTGTARARLLPLITAFLAIYVIWGSTYLAIRFAIETIPPFLMAASRFLAAGTLVYWWARRRNPETPGRTGWQGAALAGGLLLLGGNGGVVWSEQYVPSGLTALLVSTVPLWMVLLEWLRRGGQRPERGTVAGIVTGFAGVALLVGPAATVEQGRVPWLPALVLLGASISWSLGSLVSRGNTGVRSPLLAGSMQMISGGALLLAFSAARGEWRALRLDAISLQSALGWAYLVVFGSILGFSAYVWLLRETSPASVSTYAFVNPAVAVMLGWGLAAEPLTPRILLAMGLIIAAVVLVTFRRRQQRTYPAPEPAQPTAGKRLAVGPPGD